MKKYLLFTIALFAALALQSCKDDKTDERIDAWVAEIKPSL